MGVEWRRAADTALPIEKLKWLAARLTDIPLDFKLHPSVERLLAARREMGEGKAPLDWGMAENLAYASIVNEGTPVRLSGQDCGRGTFAHRHAVMHDQNRERWDAGVYVPLRNIRVVEMGTYITGPACAMQLADLGADVQVPEHYIKPRL